MIGESLILPWGGRFTGGDGDAQACRISFFLVLRATASSPRPPTLLPRNLSAHPPVSLTCVPPLSGCLRPYPSQKSTSCPMGKHISCLSTHSAPSLSLHTRLEPSRAPHIDMQSVTNLPLISRCRAHLSQKQSPALASRTESQPSSWRMACACPFTTASSTPGRVFYSGKFDPGVLFTFHSPWTGHTGRPSAVFAPASIASFPTCPALSRGRRYLSTNLTVCVFFSSNKRKKKRLIKQLTHCEPKHKRTANEHSRPRSPH